MSVKDPQPKNREASSGWVMKTATPLCKRQPYFLVRTAWGRQTQSAVAAVRLLSPVQTGQIASAPGAVSRDEDCQAVRSLLFPNFSMNTEVLFLTVREGVAMVT